MKTLDVSFADEETEADWWFEHRQSVEKACREEADQEYLLPSGEKRFAKMGKTGKGRTLIVIYRRVEDRIHIITAWEPEQ